MSAQLLLAVLSSSLIAGVLGALIGGWFTLRGKRNDYANDYFKLVLARRVQAYEEVERLISMVKTAVMDGDGRPYHMLFSKDDDKQGVYNLLFAVMSKALWLSDELFELTRELNVLIYKQGDEEHGLIEFGKVNYKQIAELRTRMEIMHLRDMLVLHEVPRFLKSKKPTDVYVSIQKAA
jgi:5-hydroxyisourate hydrolase-like protein (transthyretin family)